jgi:signal transduction histidine kinase
MRRALTGRPSLLSRVLLWLLLAGAGGAWIARDELASQREAFETDARIAHRLLSQQVVQHDAVLATLALLQPGADGAPASSAPEPRLSAVYPQILGVQRRDAGQDWPDEALRRAEVASRQSGRATLADLDFARERYRIVLAARPASYALELQARGMVPWDEWPMDPARSPVQVSLEQSGQHLVLQPGALADTPWRFDFRKHLASSSQPFDVVLARSLGWADLPWWRMLGWALLVALALGLQAALASQRMARRRAEERLRLDQVGRLNQLGELAAGMAHELNQPLTAVVANTQAAARLLREDPPDTDTARDAMTRATEQARRAADVVARLRATLERPHDAQPRQVIDLVPLIRRALDLLEPEWRRLAITPRLLAPEALPVRADPVALEQILHNLLTNAGQALEQVAAGERRLELRLADVEGRPTLRLEDSGPGFAPEVLPRIFEPFFTTRPGGLGLGLSLCESLAQSMGARLTAGTAEPRGAVFTLTLEPGLS